MTEVMPCYKALATSFPRFNDLFVVCGECLERKHVRSFLSFIATPFCVTLLRMGSKDKGKKEAKKAPKPKPKPEPGRKREGFTPAPPK